MTEKEMTTMDAWKRNVPGWTSTIAEVLTTPFPWGSGHFSSHEGDCDVTPWVLHPCFHASLDWHSSCHMQLSALRLLGCAEQEIPAETATLLREQLHQRLTPQNAEVEAAYLGEHPGYERPYGWGWAVALAAEAQDSTVAGSNAWYEALQPIVDVVADNLVAWMPKLTHPVRTGQHDNTAYGLARARDGFRALGRQDVVNAIDTHARRWFEHDVDYPAHYEPGGNDFHSAALSEAELMVHVLEPDQARTWLGSFLPNLGGASDPLLEVAEVGDTTDGKLVHLYGLNLARAAALRSLAPFVDDERAERMRQAASAQMAYSEQAIVEGDFMSTHWLVTFALRAHGVLD